MRQALWNPFPILDQNLQLSPPYFTPNPRCDTLYQNWSLNQRPFQNYLIISSLSYEQLVSKFSSPVLFTRFYQISCKTVLMYDVEGLNYNDKEKACSKNMFSSRPEGTNHALFHTKRIINHILWLGTYLYNPSMPNQILSVGNESWINSFRDKKESWKRLLVFQQKVTWSSTACCVFRFSKS